MLLVFLTNDDGFSSIMPPNEYPAGCTAHEFGCGALRVLNDTGFRQVGLYAPGQWIKAVESDLTEIRPGSRSNPRRGDGFDFAA